MFGTDTAEPDTSSLDFKNTDIEDFTLDEKLAFEKEFLGFYLTSHPHLETLSRLKLIATHELGSLNEEKEGSAVKISGIVENSKRIFTKRSNSEMAFVTLGDEKGIMVECVIFPKIFELYKHLLTNGSVVVVDGKLDFKDDQPVILADSIIDAKTLIS